MSETRLTREDHGKSIEVYVGASVVITLQESPTTGYVWINQTTGDMLTLATADFTAAAPEVMGGAGLRTLRFTVNHPGQVTLLLKRMREWEGESSVVEIFSIDIQAVQP